MAVRINKGIFIHIPKVAGTWIRAVLKHTGLFIEELCHPHDPIHIIERERGKQNVPYFCFVRHPESWIISIWAQWNSSPVYRKRNEHFVKQGRVWSYYRYSPMMLDFIREDLDETVDILTTKYCGFISRLYHEYSYGCDYVGKQEDLGEELLRVLRALGESVTPSMGDAILSFPAKNMAPGENAVKLSRKARNKMRKAE